MLARRDGLQVPNRLLHCPWRPSPPTHAPSSAPLGTHILLCDAAEASAAPRPAPPNLGPHFASEHPPCLRTFALLCTQYHSYYLIFIAKWLSTLRAQITRELILASVSA
jgi:hypothetical protein